MHPSDLVARDLSLLHISSRSHFKPTTKKTQVTRFLDSLNKQNPEVSLFVRVKKTKYPVWTSQRIALFGLVINMENDPVGPFDDPGAEPVVPIERELPVYLIDDGPNPVRLWKKLCIALTCFIIFLVFLLVIKSFQCWMMEIQEPESSPTRTLFCRITIKYIFLVISVLVLTSVIIWISVTLSKNQKSKFLNCE